MTSPQSNDPAPNLSPEGGGNRLPGLDGLRAVAVLLVLVAHYYPADGTSRFHDKVAHAGGRGVEVFFVLSGYLITHLLLREERSRGSVSLKLFYARRALRILPPLGLFLVGLYLASLVGLVAVPTIDYLASIFFFRNYAGHAPETQHLWTLAIEEQFYLVWPLALVVVPRRRALLFGCAAVVCASPCWRWVSYALAGGAANVNTFRTDLRLEPILIGSLLALLLSDKSACRLLTVKWVGGGWVAVVAIAFLTVAWFTDLLSLPFVRGLVPTLTFVCIAALINCSVHAPSSGLATVLGWAPLVWIGQLSYSLYLWQQLFAPNIPSIQRTWFRELPLGLLLGLVMAVFSYYAVERPLLSLRALLRGDRGAKPAPSAGLVGDGADSPAPADFAASPLSLQGR
jgi:peptidoglycan/LPS O-acetylase OafA/YrhL